MTQENDELEKRSSSTRPTGSGTNEDLEKRIDNLLDRVIFLEGAVAAMREALPPSQRLHLFKGRHDRVCDICGRPDRDVVHLLCGLTPAELSTNDDETIERLRGDR